MKNKLSATQPDLSITKNKTIHHLKKNKLSHKATLCCAILVVIGLLSRVLPHPPNLSPLLALALFAGAYLPRRYSMPLFFVTLLGSDILLAWIYNYPVIGSFSLFTYSGLIATILCGHGFIKGNFKLNQLLTILASNLGFWLWTCFGTWLTTNLYAHTYAGLLNCYGMGLPFLQRSMLGTVFWSIVITCSYRLCLTYVCKLPKQHLIKDTA